MSMEEPSHTLPAGYILNDTYVIDSVRGEGGFGITYAGHVKDSVKSIAIKEYFPSGVASRDHSKTPYMVTHFGGDFSVSFRKGLQRFLNEAVLLKKFAYLSSIVSILDVFETNHTAYLVMEYIEGISLKQLISSEGALPFSDLYNLFLPVMKDLAVIHEHGLIHRDISPDNLLVGLDNHLHLIDFGSVSVANPNETKTVTVILKAGYAPPEQYLANGHIGPWTDVYGLCGTMYYTLTGKPPVDALIRMQNTDTDYFPYPANSNMTKKQWQALIRGLSLSYSERYSSVKMLYQALSTPDMVEEPITVMMPPAPRSVPDSKSSGDSNLLFLIPNLKGRHSKRKKLSKLQQTTIIILSIIITGTVGQGLYKISQKQQTAKPETTGQEMTASDTAKPETAGQEMSVSETGKQEISVDEANTLLTMIDLTGSTLEDAATRISNLDTNIKLQTKYEYDEKYDIGVVIGQSVSADSTFQRGSVRTLTLTVSKGAEPTGGSNADSNTSSNSTRTGTDSDTSNKAAVTDSNSNSKEVSAETAGKTTETTTGSSTTEATQKSQSAKSTKQKSKQNTTESKYTTIHLD